MKKLLLVLLSLVMLFSFCACGAYTDEEAAKIIDALLIREADLNGYIYFDSFKTAKEPTEDDLNSQYQHYYLVDPTSKYVTLTALQSEVDRLYTKEARESVYEHAFTGISDETFSRPPRFFEDEEGLKINVSGEKYSGRTLALLGSAKVKRSNEIHILAEVTTYRFDKEGNPILHIKEIEVLLEDGAWRLMGQSLIAGTTDEALIKE